MPLPVPPHFDYASEPVATIGINEDWYSVLQGIFEFSLNPEFWDGDETDYANIEQAIIGIMTLGALSEVDEMAIKVGSYTGDGGTTKAITGVGFLPVLCIVWMRHHTDNNRGLAIRATGDTYSLSLNAGNTQVSYEDYIQTLDADGFTVEDLATSGEFRSNKSGKSYTYVAFGE